MTRTAADCAAMLAAIAGADPCDPTALLTPVPDYVAGFTGSIRGLRVGIAEAYAFAGLSEEVLTAMTGAKDALIALGARTVPVEFPSIADAKTAWLHLCLAEVAIAHEATYPSRATEYGPALGRVLEAAGKVSAGELGKAHIGPKRGRQRQNSTAASGAACCTACRWRAKADGAQRDDPGADNST
jgi:amidase